VLFRSPRSEAERRARYWELARNVLIVVGLIVLYFMQPHLPRGGA
jgi:hypothetical protein